ncbi:TPA: hypothetical protein DIC40_06025 [Patescibacteria group bacterium]|nr:hypothetical protein [Candidatus Gracilibacteria bacterium]
MGIRSAELSITLDFPKKKKIEQSKKFYKTFKIWLNSDILSTKIVLYLDGIIITFSLKTSK